MIRPKKRTFNIAYATIVLLFILGLALAISLGIYASTVKYDDNVNYLAMINLNGEYVETVNVVEYSYNRFTNIVTLTNDTGITFKTHFTNVVFIGDEQEEE